MDTSFDELIASFFDTNVMNCIRNDVMLRHRPSPYRDMDLAILGPSSINMTAELQLMDYKWHFLRETGLSPDDEDSRHLDNELEEHILAFWLQISDLLHRGTFHHFIWPEQTNCVWTSNRHSYGLLRHTIAGIDIHFILHVPKRTIAHVDRTALIDYTILKLLRAGAPVYTDFPWPIDEEREERRRQFRRKLKGEG
jgi:hypothetical protein